VTRLSLRTKLLYSTGDLSVSVPLGLSFAMMWWVPPLSVTGLAVYYAVVSSCSSPGAPTSGAPS